jgi:hypothetical protein
MSVAMKPGDRSIPACYVVPAEALASQCGQADEPALVAA